MDEKSIKTSVRKKLQLVVIKTHDKEIEERLYNRYHDNYNNTSSRIDKTRSD